jgi:dTDP-4-dehydrorhamnose 3,5-epimerase
MGIIFEETKLSGAFLITPQRFDDSRGFLARSFSQHEFEEHGLNPSLAECYISFNINKHTVRGMHFQSPPHAQSKLVRCTAGVIYDVIIDLRPSSATYGQWIAVELSAENHRMLYVPKGFAHGFQTLEEESEVFYQLSDYYAAASAGGVRWNDPAFNIDWPETKCVVINERDGTYPDFRWCMSA